MPDIFGFSRSDGPVAAVENLTAMSASINRFLSSDINYHVVNGAAGVASTQTSDCVSDDDALLVAIAGKPYWSDKELQKLAGNKGFARSIATAFRRLGPEMLERLHGPFSLSIVEPAVKRVFLAIDRIGIRPLAWTKHRDSIIFSSNAESIRAFPGAQAGIDRQALFNYLYFHMVPSPGTIYTGIEKLLPGQYVDIVEGRAKRGFYWSLPYQESTQPHDQLVSELKSQLQHSVSDAIEGTSTGSFLSGGLDSSTVSGYFSQIAGSSADAYGIGFDAEGYDEMEYARASARHFGIKLHEYYVTPEDVADALPKVASAYDEPFGNASAIPAYFCAKLAKEDGKTCLLAGDGGDEIFGGNARYAKQKVFELYSHIPQPLRSMLIEPLANGIPWGERIPPLRKLRSYIDQAKMPMPQRMESYNFLHRTDLGSIFEDGFLADITPSYPIDNLREVYNRADSSSMLKKMLHLDLKITLADNDLRKVSRMCQLAGIDVRYPMLDERLVAFSGTVPSSMLLKRLELRTFYRNALGSFLPPETLAKRKQGFGLPFGVWMSHNKRLSELADDSLVQLRKRGILKTTYINQLLDAHHSEHADYYGVMIWVLMMLEQWLSSHGH